MERQNTASVPSSIFVGPAGWSYPDWGGIVYPATARAIFTKRATWPIFLTPLKSILRFTSRSGRRLRRNGSTGWRLVPGFSLRPSSGRDSLTNRRNS